MSFEVVEMNTSENLNTSFISDPAKKKQNTSNDGITIVD